MSNPHSASHVTHMQVSLLTNAVFQDMTSCPIHCTKLRRMIQLVAMVAENVQRGIHAVNIFTEGIFMHDEFVGHGAMSRVNYFVYKVTGLSIHCARTC